MTIADVKNTVLLKDWTVFEKIWLVTSVTVITVLGFMWGDTLLGFVSSIAGILCVVLAAKGKIATFYVGIIQAGTYAYISYGYGLYGEAMLNALFYLPTQFIGLFLWLRHRKTVGKVNGEDIIAKRLSAKQWFIFTPIVLVAIAGYMILLTNIGAQQARIDSVAVVLSIAAQTLLMLRYVEQWVLWIVVNVLTITLWFITLVSTGGNDWTIFAMWVAFLVNSVYGYLNWRKISQPTNTTEKVVA